MVCHRTPSCSVLIVLYMQGTWDMYVCRVWLNLPIYLSIWRQVSNSLQYRDEGSRHVSRIVCKP